MCLRLRLRGSVLISRGEFGHEKNKICYQRGWGGGGGGGWGVGVGGGVGWVGGGGGGGGSEPFAICRIYNKILLFYSTLSFCAIIGVKDRTLYLI